MAVDRKTRRTVSGASRTASEVDGYVEFPIGKLTEKSASSKKPARKDERFFPISTAGPRLLDLRKPALVVAPHFANHWVLSLSLGIQLQNVSMPRLACPVEIFVFCKILKMGLCS